MKRKILIVDTLSYIKSGYLNLNGDGAAYEVSDSMLKTGVVGIYQ